MLRFDFLPRIKLNLFFFHWLVFKIEISFLIAYHFIYCYSFTGNIARGKPTKQSSTGWRGVAKRAVDGNLNTKYSKNSCTHTKKQKGAWWRVDLQMQYPVAKVKVTNRGDNKVFKRLSNFEVRVGNVDGDPKKNPL